MNKKQARLRRARKARVRIAGLKITRLCVNRTNFHIYAQIIDADSRVIASASTLESSCASEVGNSRGIAAAVCVGKRIAEKAKSFGVSRVAFDRSGFKYHGRVKALADAARDGGLVF